MKIKLTKIQAFLEAEHIDGWLLCGFHDQNPIIKDLFAIKTPTRKFFIFIPRNGVVTSILSQIEKDNFSNISGIKRTFNTREQMINLLKKTILTKTKIAIEISEKAFIPSVSFVDKGTFEMLTSILPSVTFVSSANIIQSTLSAWTKPQLQTHLKSARILGKIVKDSFDLISTRIKSNRPITEQEVQEFISDRFKENNLITDHLPVVASGKNTANPHFATEDGPKKIIRKNELVLIDLWAKLESDDAIFADMTWMGFTGNKLPPKIDFVWKSVVHARDNAVNFLQDNWQKAKIIQGFEVDDVCRQTLKTVKLDKFFIHRTGHSIDTDLHGKGVNLDNFETHDNRKIIPNIGFSIEPGIYLKRFGVRSEINVFIDPKQGPIITTPIQKEVILL